MKIKRYLLLFLLLISLPLVYAREVRFTWDDFVKYMSEMSRGIFKLFQNQYVVYVALIILCYVLFFNFLKRAIAKVRIFEGEAGVEPNASGKAVAHAITGMICLSIFAMRKSILDVIDTFLVPFGLFGALLIGLIVTMIAYKSIEVEHHKFWWALVVGSLAIIIYGWLVIS